MYQVDFTSNDEADLVRLDVSGVQRVFKRLRWLAENFEAITPESLTGQWQGVFTLRVGDDRVLYTCDKAHQKIMVHSVRHRCEVYKLR